MWHVIEIGWCWIFRVRVRNNMFLHKVVILGTCHLLEGARTGANGGRVIKFYVAKKGRVTKNLSWALGTAILLYF